MSAQFEHPDFPREIADAPDIDNIPVAESMHALMECVTEIYHGVRQILESMSPEATAERARTIAPLAMELARELDGAAPLDPSKVEVEITDWEDFRPGDVVVQNPAADRVEGAAFIVQRHQPAPEPEPEPEWNRAADYVATVRGIPGVRVTWSPVDDGDSNPWRTREPITDEKHSWHPESEVTDVRPLVVIDPAAVDVAAISAPSGTSTVHPAS